MSAEKLTEKVPSNVPRQLITHLWVRRGIGVLGMSFPFIMYLGNLIIFDCKDVLFSISAYHNTKLMGVFVSIMAMISIFLFTYKGPGEKDRHWATLASVLCLGVALVPTSDKGDSCEGFTTWDCEILHLIFAISLFLVLAYFCLVLFVKTRPECNPTEEHRFLKSRRNLIYQICGYSMLASMSAMLVMYLLKEYASVYIGFPYIFWGETVCLIAFGTAWITKGNWFIYSDLHLDPSCNEQ